MSDDPSALSRWVTAHPVLWGVVAAALMYAVAVVLNGLPPLVWLAPSAAFGVGNWWVWRKDGPAHRWRAYILRRFPKRR